MGIGDVAALREFIDWAAEVGFKLVQLLPINETGADNSPYNAISAMAIEPTTLHLAPNSPQDLTREDFDAAVADVDLTSPPSWRGKVSPRQKTEAAVAGKSVFEFLWLTPDEQRQSEFRAFCEQESAWLRDYAFFRVLMEANDDSAAWNRWQPQHQTIEKARGWLHDLPHDRQAALTRAAQSFFCYVQWIAHQQWRAIKMYAEERGVALMGDIPFGVSYCSADVFARPDEFVLDWFGGAPPEPHFKDDAFTQKWGQNWGIPLYRWDNMRANNFEWWRERVRAVRRIFHLVPDRSRPGILSHLCLSRGGHAGTRNSSRSMSTRCWNELAVAHRILFHVTTTHPKTAKQTNAKAKNTCASFWKKPAAARVIGEDLGVVPEYVRPNLRSLGIAGFKIPQWEMHMG